MTQFSMAILACQKESQFAQRYQVSSILPAKFSPHGALLRFRLFGGTACARCRRTRRGGRRPA